MSAGYLPIKLLKGTSLASTTLNIQVFAGRAEGSGGREQKQKAIAKNNLSHPPDPARDLKEFGPNVTAHEFKQLHHY